MKTNTRTKPIITTTLLAVLTAAISSAAITVTASDSAAAARINANDINDTIATNWDLGAANTVAVYIGTENTVAGSFTATFAGQTMNIVQTVGGGNNHLSGIAYLVNPTVTIGDIVIQANHNGAGRHSYAWGILSLSGVNPADPIAENTRTTAGDFSYETLGESFVIGNAVNNSFNFTSPPTIAGNPDTNLFAAAFDGNAGAVFAYGEIASADQFDDTYGNLDAGSTVIFNAIPEPSAALLGGLGVLALLRRRR